MIMAVFRAAVPRLSQLAIGSNARARERTPESAFVRTRNRRIGLRPDILVLGRKIRTQPGTFNIETIAHAAPLLFSKGSATLRCFAPPIRSRATALTAAHPPSK